MSYEVKSQGWAKYKSFDIMCDMCGYHEDRLLDREEFMDVDGNKKEIRIKCPNCKLGAMLEVWLQAPSVGCREGSAESVAKMKKSFNDRFIKKDLDDIRNKHGRLYDDPVKSAAASRIKKGLK